MNIRPSNYRRWLRHCGQSSSFVLMYPYYSGYNYDNNYGKNYEHKIVQPKEATLVFGDHGESKYGGPLEQGEQFLMYYSDRRLDF